MKHQYFGDVHDYRKYGLLRIIQSTGKGGLFIGWMLTPNDGRADGRRREYLDDPDRWRKYDPELFKGLANLIPRGSEPCISPIEGTCLLPRASCHWEEVPDARTSRDVWRENLLRAASGSGADFVFLDPDNGIEVPSKPVGRKGSCKYSSWIEVEGLWNLGCSLLVYQHYPREPRESFAGRMVTSLRDRLGTSWVEAFRTPHVLFLLAAQRRHEARARDAVALVRKLWPGQIEPMGFA